MSGQKNRGAREDSLWILGSVEPLSKKPPLQNQRLSGGSMSQNIFILRFQNMLHICGWSMQKGQFDKKAVERLNRMTWLYERLPEKKNKIV